MTYELVFGTQVHDFRNI